MNQEQQIIIDTAKRIFTDECGKETVDAAEAGEFPRQLWDTLVATGLTTIGLEAEEGGTFTDALLVVREAGAAAAPIPLAEHLLAISLLVDAGLDVPDGCITVGLVESFARPVCQQPVQFIEDADWVLLVADQGLMLLPSAAVKWQTRRGITGLVTGTVSEINQGNNESVSVTNAAQLCLIRGAMLQVNLMAGAMNRILEMSVQYVSERQQFGRPLAKFQAIQHQLANLAGETAACLRAADSLLFEPTDIDVAIAKARVGEAVAVVADISHQVHGAIGYTLEHGLNLRTRRLWQWRDSYGTERYWQEVIGRHFCAGEDLWSDITALG